MSSEHYDVIIMGGGSAGLTAGIYLGRAKVKTLIINEGTIGGQMVLTHAVANYPGVLETGGFQLSQIMKEQARQFGCKLESNVEVTKIDLKSDRKIIEIDEDEIYTADAVIVATGGSPRKLGLSSEEKFKGLGISYCATCDGDFYQGKDIIVVGGGNSALEEAVSLTKWVRSVKIVHQFDHFQAHQHAIDEAKKNDKITFIMESEILEFLGDEKVSAVKVKNNKSGEESVLEIDGVFVYIGYIPNSGRFKGLLNMNDFGEIITNDEMKTSLPGVFAAGDVRRKKYRQITTAVADGTVAALSAIEYIHK